MSALQEQSLITKCRNGDSSAFSPLIRTYRKQLFSYLFRLCGNREEAEDLFQDTLIKAWKGINNYSERHKFSSWLFAIAHNTAMDALRKRKKENVFAEIELDELQHSDNPHNELINLERSQKLKKAVEELPLKQKEVFLLRINSGMKFKEIAKLTNEPLNTVLSHMHYSINKIKYLLGNKND
jgi:RNA polymerase sigma-70 factor, ECF subfamily